MLWPKNTHISKPFLACQKAIKPTYSNLEFQNFPGEDPRTPRFMGEGKGGKGWEGRGRKGRRDGKGRGGEEGVGKGKGGEGRTHPLEILATPLVWTYHVANALKWINRGNATIELETKSN